MIRNICYVLPENWDQLLKDVNTPIEQALWIAADWFALLVGYSVLGLFLFLFIGATLMRLYYWIRGKGS